MDTLEQVTIDRIIGATANIVDRHKNLAALAYGESRGIDRAEIMAMILGKRFAWLDRLTVTQRKWQAHTKNVNKANHHDSIELREKYVRC